MNEALKILTNYQTMSVVSLTIGLLFLLTILLFMVLRKNREGVWTLGVVILVQSYPLALLAFKYLGG